MTAEQGERIAKVMARAGVASRRQAEEMIAAGRVTVNGKVITSPALNVTASDRITVDGNPLPQRERTRLFLFHKSRDLVTTHSDPQGRPTIFSTLPKNLPRLISVGRLDINTEGLLLLTNDGELARMLELPQTGWLRIYRVRALGRITQAELDRLKGGVTIKGVRYGPIEGAFDREQGANVWLTIGIREGKNREVRNVLEDLGLKVNRLIRVSFGPFELGDLARGAVEEVPTATLREVLGADVIAGANVDFGGPVLEREVPPRRHYRTRPQAPSPATKNKNPAE
jgi:23S rRNA pseudouridine2605 synthase